MTIRVYNVETKETIHEFELSNRIKKESSILQKVKEQLEIKYGKKPRLIFQGRLDFRTKSFDDDSGYLNNLGIGKFNYMKV